MKRPFSYRPFLFSYRDCYQKNISPAGLSIGISEQLKGEFGLPNGDQSYLPAREIKFFVGQVAIFIQ